MWKQLLVVLWQFSFSNERRKENNSEWCLCLGTGGCQQKASCFQVLECSLLKPNAQQMAPPHEAPADSSTMRALNFHLHQSNLLFSAATAECFQRPDVNSLFPAQLSKDSFSSCAVAGSWCCPPWDAHSPFLSRESLIPCQIPVLRKYHQPHTAAWHMFLPCRLTSAVWQLSCIL